MLELDRSMWTRVAFGDVVKNVNVAVRNPEAAGIDRIIAMEHLDPGELRIGRWGNLDEGTTFTRRVKPGQTLFGKRRAYQRKAALVEFDAITSGDILVFEADAIELLPEFLPFLVQSNGFYDHALGTSAGSLSPRTNWRDLANYEFDLPPVEEQKHLADLLWAIESHRERLTDNRSATAAVEGSIMSQVSQGERSVGEVVKIARSGGTPLRSNQALYGGGIPWLKSGEVTGDGISSTQETITKEALQGSAAWLAPAGAVVVAMYGDGKTRGQVGRIAVPMTTNQAVLALVPDESECDPDFLYYWLRSRQEDLRTKGAGAAQRNLSKSLVISEPFPGLAVEEQHAAVRSVKALDAAALAVDIELQTVHSLRGALLARVFGDAE